MADADKVLAARRVLESVAAVGADGRELVDQMRRAIEGYIELAAMPVGKDDAYMPFPAAFRRLLT